APAWDDRENGIGGAAGWTGCTDLWVIEVAGSPLSNIVKISIMHIVVKTFHLRVEKFSKSFLSRARDQAPPAGRCRIGAPSLFWYLTLSKCGIFSSDRTRRPTEGIARSRSGLSRDPASAGISSRSA